MSDLEPVEMLGDHADHLAARRQRRVRHHAHQTDPPAAVDQPDAARRQGAAQGMSERMMGRRAAGPRAAEYGEGFDGGHACLRERARSIHGATIRIHEPAGLAALTTRAGRSSLSESAETGTAQETLP